MIINQRDSAHSAVIEAGRLILNAIRTAPKARGVDIIEAIMIEGDDIPVLSNQMLQLFEETRRPVFKRDGNNILQADAIILLGYRPMPIGLNCAHCGYPQCSERPEGVPCAFNQVDLGIAIGSAVSLAADLRIDSRVMYSAGMAAMRCNLLPDCKGILAISLSVSSKNPFFDRK